MKSENKYPLLVFFCLVLLSSASCTKKVYEPGLKGNMVGYVITFDEFSEPLPDHSGVEIHAIGLDGVFQTFTDRYGRFEFKNLPTDTYELHFEKAGFSPLKQFGVQHLGGEPTILLNSWKAYFLFQTSSGTITITRIDHDSIFCECSFTKTPVDPVSIQLFASTDADFLIDETEALDPNTKLLKVGNLYAGRVYHRDLFTIPGLPYSSGETVYLRACICPNFNIRLDQEFISFGIIYYYDYDKNLYVYPGLGKESELFTYVIP